MAKCRSLFAILVIGVASLMPSLSGTQAHALDTKNQQFEKFLDQLDLNLAIEIGDSPVWKAKLMGNPKLQNEMLRIVDKAERHGFLRQFGNPDVPGADAETAFQRQSAAIRSLLEQSPPGNAESLQQLRSELAKRFDAHTLRKVRSQLMKESRDASPTDMWGDKPQIISPETKRSVKFARIAATVIPAAVAGLVTRKVSRVLVAGVIGYGAGSLSAKGVARFVTGRRGKSVESMADVLRAPGTLTVAEPVGARSEQARGGDERGDATVASGEPDSADETLRVVPPPARSSP